MVLEGREIDREVRVYTKIQFAYGVEKLIECKDAQWEVVKEGELDEGANPKFLRLDIEDEKGCKTFHLERGGDGNRSHHIYFMNEDGKTIDSIGW